ncbi:filamentous hemagglutinin family outer membrane protein [Candidatus Magnetoovum chiemensis]|nr:filamentous hemagglutinin family outer membrane protein [Candidatus Magnetoovum chiemensis]
MKGIAASLILAAALLIPAQSYSEITLDGTLGQSGSINGPNYEIGAGMGQQLDQNLFHSFGAFNVYEGEKATFTGPSAIDNVISRVTGGFASTINGALSSSIDGANVYFLNPAGVIFGPNATLDITGSFHVSTADYIGFSDGGRFDASNPSSSVLTSAQPSAFGFLSDAPKAITVEGGTLEVGSDETVSIIAGGVNITDGGTVSAPSGRINVVSVASAGEVELTADGINMTGFGTLGAINLRGVIDVSGESSDGIYIRGGEFLLDNGYVSAENSGTEDGGDIDIKVDGELEVTGSHIFTATSADGAAGDVNVEAETVRVDGSGDLASVGSITGKESSGAGGSVSVNAKTIDLLDGGMITAFINGSGGGGDINIEAENSLNINGAYIVIYPKGTGEGGDININAAGMKVFNNSAVYNNAFGSGNAGDININVMNLEITDGGVLVAAAYGEGDAGNIDIAAVDYVRLNGYATGIVTEAATGSTGNGGYISIDSADLEIADGAVVSASSDGEGNAGDITINVYDTMTVFGLYSGIGSQGSYSIGNGGDVNISAGSLYVSDYAQIGSATYGAGDAGDVVIAAVNISVSGKALIASQAADPKSTGKGGNVIIKADVLEVLNGAGISAGTFGAGDAGDVLIDAKDTLRVAGLESLIDSQAAPGSSGNGGNVEINSSTLEVMDGSWISASTFEKGKGGNIEINADSITLIGDSTITAENEGTGEAGGITITSNGPITIDNSSITVETTQSDGGDITINTPSLDVLESDITATVKGGAGNGGNIYINAPEYFVLDKSRVIANAEEGSGGNIVITSDAFIPSLDSVVTASSRLGIQGSVEIKAPDVNIGSSLISSQASFVSADALLPKQCTEAAAKDERGKFTVKGLKNIYAEPTQLQSGR